MVSGESKSESVSEVSGVSEVVSGVSNNMVGDNGGHHFGNFGGGLNDILHDGAAGNGSDGSGDNTNAVSSVKTEHLGVAVDGRGHAGNKNCFDHCCVLSAR